MPQNYGNHTRFDPKFHFFLFPLTAICFIASIVHTLHAPTPPNVLLVPTTACVMLLAATARLYAIRVQDRVIRLEEAIRLKALGVDASALKLPQLVALRFASDAEVAALARRAVAEHMTSKQIKQAIVNWRPDEHRV